MIMLVMCIYIYIYKPEGIIIQNNAYDNMNMGILTVTSGGY